MYIYISQNVYKYIYIIELTSVLPKKSISNDDKWLGILLLLKHNLQLTRTPRQCLSMPSAFVVFFVTL